MCECWIILCDRDYARVLYFMVHMISIINKENKTNKSIQLNYAEHNSLMAVCDAQLPSMW